VIHLAALPSAPRFIQDPLTTNAVNIAGTRSVVLAARDAGTRRGVMASSLSVYGPRARELPKAERPLRPSELQLEANGFEDLPTQVRFNQLTQILLQAASIQRADLVAQGDRIRAQTGHAVRQQDFVWVDAARGGLARGQRNHIDHWQCLVDALSADDKHGTLPCLL